MSLTINAKGIVGDMKVFLINNVDGKEVRSEPKTLMSGDVIEYVITYSNNSSDQIKDVGVKGKIPEGTEFLKGSATPTNELYFSIDHSQTWSTVPLSESTIGGELVEQAARAESYNAIKWNIKKFNSKEQRVFIYRVQVI